MLLRRDDGHSRLATFGVRFYVQCDPAAKSRETIVSASKEPAKPGMEPSSSDKAPSPDNAANIGRKGDAELTESDLDAVAGGTSVGSATGGAGAGKVRDT